MQNWTVNFCQLTRIWTATNGTESCAAASEQEARKICDHQSKERKVWRVAKMEQDRIPDYYCANMLRIPVAKCPQDLIEAKRVLIKARRQLKQQTKQQNASESKESDRSERQPC